MKLGRNIILGCFLLVQCNLVFSQDLNEIEYFQSPTIPFDWKNSIASSSEFTDSISGNVIKIFHNKAGIALFYSQDIFTSVCFDDQCRPLNLTVYWNVTGRYFGFRLPKKEFLSRYDHEPFSPIDYEKLNSLLADPYLPLGNVAFQELIEYSKDSLKDIDGVSGATSKRILDYIVEGAAYTTYTMWNIVYGQTKKLIERKTEQEMTPELLASILKSSTTADVIWTLKRIDPKRELDAQILKSLLDLMYKEDFFTAYSAISSISPIHLRSEYLQLQLFLSYEKVNYSLRKEILDKLKGASEISPLIIERSHKMLPHMNGEQLEYLLDLYRKHKINDTQTCESVAALLHAKNAFIAKKSFDFLSLLEDLSEDIVQEMANYQSKRR